MTFQHCKLPKYLSLFFQILILAQFFISCKSSVATVVEPVVKKTNEVYTETIPLTNESFEMVLVPEGEFLMGSPADETNRKDDEGPQKKVA